MTVPCCLAKSTTRRENRAPFGAILCAARGQMCGWVKTHPYKSSGNRLFLQAKGCRECGIPFCVLKECIAGASIARPCPFVLQENCPGKCVAAPSRRATNGRPYTCNRQEGVGGPRGGGPGHPSQECGAQFSVTVMVPILVLSGVVLPNAPFRDSEAVALGAASTVVPTALSRLSDALSKVPVMPSKPASAA